MKNDKDLMKIKRTLDATPKQSDISTWKSALRAKQRQSVRPSLKPWLQWVAAVVIGFLLGAGAFYRSQPEWVQELVAAKNLDDDATIEYIYTNSN